MLTESGNWKPPLTSSTVKNPAPLIAGIASKKENRAASFGDKPKKSAAQIVIPLRETPGIMATAWAQPIKIDVNAVLFKTLEMKPARKLKAFGCLQTENTWGVQKFLENCHVLFPPRAPIHF